MALICRSQSDDVVLKYMERALKGIKMNLILTKFLHIPCKNAKTFPFLTLLIPLIHLFLLQIFLEKRENTFDCLFSADVDTERAELSVFAGLTGVLFALGRQYFPYCQFSTPL